MKLGGGSVFVDSLFYVPPIVCGGSMLVIVLLCNTWCAFLSFAIILTRKRELQGKRLTGAQCP